MIGTTWQVIANVAKSEGAKVEAILPSEGATGWSDTWMVSTQSKHEAFHADDAAYAKQIWYWSPPITQCLDGRTDVKCNDYSA